MQNVLLYPHSADIDDEKLMRAVEQFSVNLDFWKAGKILQNEVSKEKGFWLLKSGIERIIRQINY